MLCFVKKALEKIRPYKLILSINALAVRGRSGHIRDLKIRGRGRLEVRDRRREPGSRTLRS